MPNFLEMESIKKTLCKYGDNCYRKNADHLSHFYHNSLEISSQEKETDDIKESRVLLEEKENIESRRDSLEKNSNAKRQKLNDDVDEDDTVEKLDLSTVESNLNK